MLSTIITAFVLGSFSGLAPGPYTTMVAGTALERGFRAALRLALAPLVTDLIPLVATALVLDQLNWMALTMLGIAGGVIVAAVGVRFLKRHATPDLHAVQEPTASASFMHVVLSVFLSPSPWLFWLILGSPLLLRAWGRSWQEGVVFLAVTFAMIIGGAMSLAWLASHSRRLLSPGWRRRVLQVVGAALVLTGALLVWQSMEGNFQALIDREQAMRMEMLERIE